MTYTLAADGSSDRALLPVITWSLKRHGFTAIAEQWADFSRIPNRPRLLKDRLAAALDLYPCDVLFVHRDAEGQDPGLRREEIVTALPGQEVTHIPVIPVRMTEAWLLGNETSIRMAAGNPKGTDDLGLPKIVQLERLPDPKNILHSALRKASGLNRRRQSKLPVEAQVFRIPAYIDDYSFLDRLPSFSLLQADIQALARKHEFE